ncbi:hypothetical protein C8T65DRAFT_698027 [Cerioporus squamosus]|nr:hypothetical protein C8T65DRAFT_698027 [Cerioporus squamosus]
MSSDADAAAAAIVFEFDALQHLLTQLDSYTQWYCQLAACVLFLYDIFVTFNREVASFWAVKRTGASFLFFANRWISMTFYTMVLVVFAPLQVNGHLISHNEATNASSQVFSALRAYVLSTNKLLGMLFLVLTLAPVGANLVHFGYPLFGQNYPPFGCLQIVIINQAIELRRTLGIVSAAGMRTHPRNHTVTIVSRVPLILADILLIYITWTKLSSRAALMNIRQSRRMSLSYTLSLDGTIYFVVLFILNVLHLALSVTALAGSQASGVSYVTAFTAPYASQRNHSLLRFLSTHNHSLRSLTAILISRFLLDLQEANQAVVRVDPDDPLHTSRDAWDDTHSFLSSLGAFINPDLPERSDGFGSHDVSRSDGVEEDKAQASQAAAPSLSLSV